MKLIRIILILIGFYAGSSAYAVLGGKESSINTDQTKLRATSHVRSAANPSFTTHVLTGPMNTVTEYVDSSGTVFAVSWHGVVKPDLSVLLGSYYTEYHAKDAARPRMRSRAPVNIETPNVVVMKSGHMRDIRGTAYLPGRLPAGVSVGDLQ